MAWTFDDPERDQRRATADRYAIEVSAGQLPDAKQQVAAQYLMLTAH